MQRQPAIQPLRRAQRVRRRQRCAIGDGGGALDPESDLYNKELIVDDVSKGKTADGREAWVATFTDFENHRSAMCVWIWSGGNTPFRSNYVYDVGRCREAGTS